MCGGLVVLSPGSPSQVLCGVLIMLFHMLVVLRTAPFLRDSEDVSSFVSSLGLTLMYLGAFVKILQRSNEKSQKNANLSYVGLILDILPVLCIGLVLGIMCVMDCGVCNVCLRVCRRGKKSNNSETSAGMTRVTPLKAKNQEGAGNNKVSVAQSGVAQSEQLRSVRLEFGASSKEYQRALQQHA